MIVFVVAMVLGISVGLGAAGFVVLRALASRLPERPVEPASGYPDEPVSASSAELRPGVDAREQQLALLSRATGALQPYGLMHVAGGMRQ